MAGESSKEICWEKRRFWQEHVEVWQSSGMSQAGYCRCQGLIATRFTYWKKRLAEEASGITFVPVPVGAVQTVSTNEAKGLALVLGRYRIEIGDDFNPGTLLSLIRALGVQ
jgi:hypothetical protein